jgi:predicted dehydrogenase
MQPVRVGLIGVGSIAEYVHVPGLRCAPGASLVAIADTDAKLLDQRARDWGPVKTYQDPQALLADPEIDAVIIATPNDQHAPLAIAAARAAKHVLCEKPLALSLEQARQMYRAAEEAGIVHMTAFSYRFVPAMRYLHSLVHGGMLGDPRHFRAQRFQDWPETSLGWRQWRDRAGSGELADMASHRIDYGHYLIGRIRSVCGAMKRFVPRDRDPLAQPVRPSDTDDWVAFLADFQRGTTGVFESTKLAIGHGSGGRGHDLVEINGSEASAIYELRHPYRLLLAKKGQTFEEVEVPREFWKLPGSQREAGVGDPERVWRWDQDVEFILAIQEGRPAQPSFYDGLLCQAVIEAVIRSAEELRWYEVPDVESVLRVPDASS